MPAGAGRLIAGTQHNWAYLTEPQAQLSGRSLYWPRGKVLGGSSSINAMIHLRGHRADFDTWRDNGCEGWGYDEVAPYFDELETRLGIRSLSTPDPFFNGFLAAGAALGYRADQNFNDGAPDGFGRLPLAIRCGERQSASRVFLAPARTRRNLVVALDSEAMRVLIRDGRAYGVEYRREGEAARAVATREIVLCAGAVNTPKLLMLSGIGPGETLRDLNVDVVVDSPHVGRHLQDHVCLTFHFARRVQTSEKIGPYDRESAADEYAARRSGPLASQALEVGAFVRSDERMMRPDLQLLGLSAHMRDHGRQKTHEPAVTIHVCLLQPRSLGSIVPDGPDLLAPPRIDPAYLNDPRDLEVLATGAQLVRKMTVLDVWGGVLGPELFPGPRASLRVAAESIYHPVGTVGMGRVLDSRLRVKGLDALRVVDASSFPAIPSANTNAAVMMAALKGAAMLLEDTEA